MLFSKQYKAIMEAYVVPNQLAVYKTEFGKDYDAVEPTEDFFKMWRMSNTKKKQSMLKLMDKGFGVSAKYVDPEKKTEQVLLSYKP